MLKNTNAFLVNIVCPDNSTTTRKYSVRDTVQDVISDSCKHLHIKRPDIFGVAVYEYNEYRFISLKKRLNKLLPGEAVVTDSCQKTGAETNDGKEKSTTVNESTLKTCRLYLRVKQFLINVNHLEGKTLYYYYEQSRLDTLKYQNWLQLDGLSDVFIGIAAKTIWLRYRENWKDILEKRKIVLSFFLPVCAETDDIWTVLENQLIQIERHYGNDKTPNGSIIDKLPFLQPDSTSSSSPKIRVEVIKDEDPMIMDVKEAIMISVVHDTMQLPYYGIHYYHVHIRNDESNLTNCKLGVGPFGLMVVVSPYYTTWSESVNISWKSILDVNHEKNLLKISALESGSKELECHQFECLDEKEARHLFKRLKETHSFQISQKNKVQRKKRNSVGVFNPNSNKPPDNPLQGPARIGSSFSFLGFPKRTGSTHSA